MRRVKGSIMLDFVKVVHRARHLPWDRYLTAQDFELVESMILPSSWYPLETYQRIGLAVYELLGQGRPENARRWGQESMARLMEGVYQKALLKGDPLEAIKSFITLRKTLIDFGEFALNPIGPGQVEFIMFEVNEIPGLEPFSHMFVGNMEKLAAANGGREVTVEFSDQRRNDRPARVFQIRWRP